MRIHKDDKLFVGVILFVAIIVLLKASFAEAHHNTGSPIPVIVKTTKQKGWPHAPTTSERIAVTRRILHEQYSPNYQTAVRCVWPRPTVGVAVCRVDQRKLWGRGPKQYSYRVDFRAWEDGSWRLYYYVQPA